MCNRKNNEEEIRETKIENMKEKIRRSENAIEEFVTN